MCTYGAFPPGNFRVGSERKTRNKRLKKLRSGRGGLRPAKPWHKPNRACICSPESERLAVGGSCNVEFCYRIARLSTELSCEPVYILGTTVHCIQCNLLHSRSRQMPLWTCHSGCWNSKSQSFWHSQMQRTGSRGRKLSTAGSHGSPSQPGNRGYGERSRHRPCVL
jgi:hypothetical protein